MLFTMLVSFGLFMTIWVELVDGYYNRNVPISFLRYLTWIVNGYIILKSIYLIYCLWFQPNLNNESPIINVYICGVIAIIDIYYSAKFKP